MSTYICSDCNRVCGAIRQEGFGRGFCKSGLNPVVALAKPHFGEEPCISGTRGSGTVFFSGCSLKCVFCQNYIISHLNKGKDLTPEQLATVMCNLEKQGVHNINLVNPTHYTYGIGKALTLYKPNIPIIYNTNSYEQVATIQKVAKWSDVFLADLKLISSSRCKRYLGAENYFYAADKAIDEMLKQKPENKFQNGIMMQGVIIRILVLPCNIDEAFKICDHIKKRWGSQIMVSVMSQYYPAGVVSDSNFNEINRALTKREYARVCDYFVNSGFTSGFYQEIATSNGNMTPDFNLEGVDGVE